MRPIYAPQFECGVFGFVTRFPNIDCDQTSDGEISSQFLSEEFGWQSASYIPAGSGNCRRDFTAENEDIKPGETSEDRASTH